MIDYDKTLFEDILSPADEIERDWFRKPLAVILTIMFIPLILFFNVIESVFISAGDSAKFFKECWVGKHERSDTED